jgi:hypothetical protein
MATFTTLLLQTRAYFHRNSPNRRLVGSQILRGPCEGDKNFDPARNRSPNPLTSNLNSWNYNKWDMPAVLNHCATTECVPSAAKFASYVIIKVVPQITRGRGFIAGLLASAERRSYLACVQRHQTQGSQLKHNWPSKYPLSQTVCRISGNVTLVWL